MATKNKTSGLKTYRALRRTWLSHEARMVDAGEVFTTEFPKVPKVAEEGVVKPDADGTLRVRRDVRKAGEEPEMVDMVLGDNIELADGEEEVTEPAIGTEHGDKEPDMKAVLKSAQDHIDRQRASLPSPGMPREEGAGEPQRAMDGPPTAETDDDKDAPARRAAEQRRAAEEQQRAKGRTPRG